MIFSSNLEHIDSAPHLIERNFDFKTHGYTSKLGIFSTYIAASDAKKDVFGKRNLCFHVDGVSKVGPFCDQPEENYVSEFPLKFHGDVWLSRLFGQMLQKVKRNTLMVGRSFKAALANYAQVWFVQRLIDDKSVYWINRGHIGAEYLQRVSDNRAKIKCKMVNELSGENILEGGIRHPVKISDVEILV